MTYGFALVQVELLQGAVLSDRHDEGRLERVQRMIHAGPGGTQDTDSHGGREIRGRRDGKRSQAVLDKSQPLGGPRAYPAVLSYKNPPALGHNREDLFVERELAEVVVVELHKPTFVAQGHGDPVAQVTIEEEAIYAASASVGRRSSTS